MIADQAGNTVWRNDNTEPFGDSVPNDDPNSTGNHFDFPLGLSLYYRDKETGNFYAMLRDAYGPDIGRFPQSDPIGLKGGSLSPYVYVNNNPLGAIDPLGLVNWKGTFGGISLIKGAGAGFFRFDLTSECKCNKRIRIQGYVSTIAAGIGAKYTGTGGSAEFYDYRDCPDAGIANGGVFIASAGAVFGGGVSCTKMTVGHLYSGFGCGGPTYGFDFSAGAYIGASIVTDAKEECCGK